MDDLIDLPAILTEMQLRFTHKGSERLWFLPRSHCQKVLGLGLKFSFHLIPKPMLFTNILSWPMWP